MLVVRLSEVELKVSVVDCALNAQGRTRTAAGVIIVMLVRVRAALIFWHADEEVKV